MNKLEVFDIHPGSTGGLIAPTSEFVFALFNNYLYFPASDPQEGEELFRIGLNSDSEPELFAKPRSNGDSAPRNLTVVGESLFFTATNGSQTKLFQTDGIDEFKETSFDIIPYTFNSSPNNLIAVKDNLFFFSAGANHLYKIDTTQDSLDPELVISSVDVKSDFVENPIDLNTVENAIAFGDSFYFTAEGVADRNTELYWLNGNALEFQEIAPGTDANQSSNPNNFIVVGDNLYFFADPDGGDDTFKLFQKGTSGKAVEVAKDTKIPLDIHRNAGIIEIEGKLYFASNDGANGTELFEFDPADPDEATKLTELDSSDIQNITKAGHLIYFTAGSQELYRYDTTVEIGSPVTQIAQIAIWDSNNLEEKLITDANINNLLVIDDTLYFTANDTVTSTGLYQLSTSDPEAIPEPVYDIGGFPPELLFNADGNLFFRVNDGGNDAKDPDSEGTGMELWKLSDAESPVRLVSELQGYVTESSIPTIPNQDFAYDSNFAYDSDKKTLYFIGSGFIEDDPTGKEIWKLDNNNPNAVPEILKNLDPSSDDLEPKNLFIANNTLYFVARQGFNETFRLWQSDGTESGTQLADQTDRDFTFDNVDPSHESFLQVGNTLYFAAEKDAETEKGIELFSFDLSNPSAEVTGFDDQVLDGNANPEIRNLTEVGNRVYFIANVSNAVTGLFYVNGNAGLINRANKDITQINDLTVVGDTVYFTAKNSSGDRRLYQSDSNTTKIVEATENFDIPDDPESLIYANNALYFAASDSENTAKGEELYKFNLNNSTIDLTDINDGNSDSAPRNFTLVDDNLYFSAIDGDSGRELFKVDTTASSLAAELVEDVNPDGDSNPEDLTAINGNLFFTAIDGKNGRELWQTDGEETTIVEDLYPGSSGADPSNLLVADNQLYFTADDGKTGLELWSVSVTPPPTVAFKQASFTEAEGKQATVTLTRSGEDLSDPSKVTVSITGGNATAGDDYNNSGFPLEVEFAAGQTEKTFNVSLLEDDADENTETITFKVETLENAELGSQSNATLNITDYVPPTVGFQQTSVTETEGDSGNTDLSFTVSLSEASTKFITVDYATANDTAIAGQDYIAKNGTLEFAPGETQKAIAIEVIGDSDIEQDESFKVNLSSPNNAEIGISSFTGIIQNDDINTGGNTGGSTGGSTGGNTGGNTSENTSPKPLELAGGTAQIAYVAYYGRPADQGGLDFWNDNLAQNNVSYSPQQGNGLTGQEEDVYNQIVNQFGTADEADRLFGGFDSNREKVNQVYQFAFNRDGDAGGLDYWTSQIEQGNVTLATFALEVALGAQNDDIITLNNKVESADMFTDDVNTKGINAYSGSYGENFGRNWLSGYGETVSSQAELDSALTDLVNGSPI